MQKYLTKKQSTILGHLQLPRKGLRSTQKKELQSEPEPEPEPGQDQFPPYMQSGIATTKRTRARTRVTAAVEMLTTTARTAEETAAGGGGGGYKY